MARGDREELRQALLDAGACAAGFCKAESPDEHHRAAVRDWLDKGFNAGMQWMERHAVLRQNPDNILPGVNTIIVMAFRYRPDRLRRPELPLISRYAYGADYHNVIRERLKSVTDTFFSPGSARICIDSAPLDERYWAQRAGIGMSGLNGAILIPGIGGEIFLAEILTTDIFEPDAPTEMRSPCLECGACIKACPTGALLQEGMVDCRRCISYLTIEHRGPWIDPVSVAAMNTKAAKNTLFGCDRCISVCPLNTPEPTPVEEFHAQGNILDLDIMDLPETATEFKKIFRNSAISRCGFDGLLRNAANLEKSQ